jgi:hypothetical protein
MGRAYIAAVAAGSAGSPWQPGAASSRIAASVAATAAATSHLLLRISERYRNGKSRDGVDGRVSVGVVLAMHFA